MEFFVGKSILITGATGFLAKVLVEKILRTQPHINKLFLLIRANDSESATKRFHTEVFESELFKVVKEKYGEGKFRALVEEKVFPVAGDISSKLLGIENCDQILREVNIIINSAATTTFDERYDVAMSINTLGAINVLNFAKKCLQLNMILHVSTAYVCGDKTGNVQEKAFHMGETVNGNIYLDIDEEKKVIEDKLIELRAQNATEKQIKIAMKILGIQRAKLHGWPNTYSFTKAMGEMLFSTHKENLCVVTLRPTIITSTYKEPFPGWIEGARTMDIFVLMYGKGKSNFMMGDPDSILDAIPGDMVVNSILAAVVHHGSGHHKSLNNNNNEELIYHVGSSCSNPLTILHLCNYLLSYFTNNPWSTKSGELVKVGKPVLLTNAKELSRYIAFHYLPILKVLKMLNVVLFHYFEEKCATIEKNINFVTQLVELYKPYLFFYGSFDDTNAKRLRMDTSTTEILNFDPKCIQWEDYFINTHIPGVVKYAF